MSKINKKKQEKEKKLLDTAFNLFISKGIHTTTIQDIVNEAGVAKGTFYLYFRDKQHIIEALISTRTVKLFEEAIAASRRINYKNFTQQFLFIIDYIIDELTENKKLLKFIYKNLSVGMDTINLKDTLENTLSKPISDLFVQRAKEDGLNLKDPSVSFFMIIELVGATCYSSILFNKPLPIEAYKPYLYDAVEKLLK